MAERACESGAVASAKGRTRMSMRNDDRLKPSPEAVRQSLARLDGIAKLMDSAFTIPGTNIKMGLDGLIGLLPVAGDAITSLVSCYLIWEAHELGASRWLLARMSANVAIDGLLGSVPVIGDAFDVMFRANLKNMALLRQYLAREGLLVDAPMYDGGPVIEGTSRRMA